MSKYIPAEKLVAEIERRMKDYNASIEKYYDKQKSIKAERDSWKWAECKWFLNLITSLQQEQPQVADASKMEPEVDLEKEVRIYCSSSFKFNYDELNDSFYSNAFEFDDVIELARNFYELGLNARKEESE